MSGNTNKQTAVQLAVPASAVSSSAVRIETYLSSPLFTPGTTANKSKIQVKTSHPYRQAIENNYQRRRRIF